MKMVEDEKFRWILHCGWKGLCPRCGEGKLFSSWLKIADLVVWLQVALEPPFWVHLLTSFPLISLGCALPLRPIKGWLVASQYVNKAQEAGTEKLWAQLNGASESDEWFEGK